MVWGIGYKIMKMSCNRIELTKKQIINCHLTGKLRMNYIRILPGDKVQIRVSPYDLSNGTISYRYRDDKK